MFRIRRRAGTPDRVRFCDGCAEVTTADQRAHARIERTRTHLTTLTGPR
ncbi:hypothetical protein ABZS66_53095 [Dactylosporangium sp. NPDC005572]